jgi:hypothetical protein
MSDRLRETGLKPLRSVAPAEPKGINWKRVFAWFCRAVSLGWIVLGLFAWAQIIDLMPAGPRGFEARAMTFQGITIYFAVIDLVAAVGLWLLAPWGLVVWLIAAVSRIVMAFAFPAAASLSLVTLITLGALIAAALALTFAASRHED